MKFLIIFCALAAELTAILDLDTLQQPFVLETKQIHIPGYPDAFNPCIVKWDNRLLMSFRARDTATNKANLVGLIWLDDQFNPIGKPQFLSKDTGAYIQDPRLFSIGSKLYMAYSDLWEQKRIMCMAELEGTWLKNQDRYLDFSGDLRKFEKNWVPFEYQGQLLLSYSLNPHKIFLPIPGENRCITLAENPEQDIWDWGDLRGGTPAILINGHYLAFFHSSTLLATVQSGGQPMMHYVMGAYQFAASPPFAIQKISPKPIIHHTFYNGPAHNTWKPLRVVFPCGIIHNQKYIWVSYGRQDHEAWVVKLDKAALFNSLVPFH